MTCDVSEAWLGIVSMKGGAPALLRFKLGSRTLHGALVVLLNSMMELGRRRNVLAMVVAPQRRDSSVLCYRGIADGFYL
jgi:hypothetical protein